MATDVTEQRAENSASKASLPFDELTVDERVEFIPQQIFDFKKKEPAFLFSQDNLRTIKRYQRAVRLLPRERREMEANVNFTALAISADDFWSFHENLHQHVDAWDGVEDACKTMGGDLQVFSENFITEGVKFIAELKNTQAMDTLLPAIPADKIPRAALSTADITSLKSAIDLYLPTIQGEITEMLATIRHVKALVDHFGEQIDKVLHPKGSGLLACLKKESVDKKIATIGEQLIALDTEIEKKVAQYDKLVGTAFFGIAFGPIGLIVTGGIYGAQAEVVRKDKNALIEERDMVATQQRELLAEIENFVALKRMVTDINFRLVEVRAATKNLEDVWVLLESYMSASIKKATAVSSNVELKKFIVQFERVLSPWTNILNISKQLSAIFNEALGDAL
ncbi:alpha-xenorhabdolysin family binary toxin subunit A [Pseudomonas sp. RAC1]|uniref:alpha-xenorhabdolysin family binary toxin subunit A n=1 Tax=Pseudomonas sp. RAC1 TaxID=3064900 RepID=UPI002723AC9B|nr:alpha-xenorhabdolysin family binary toxin subunit A [Pseudomonas sp. RAC1]MDV9032105.1 alpha-xenorhabdolysin family binary toxin subunit A [Pseudomonas sp. RAC1]